MSEIVVITDTSVLINFLVLNRTDLLARLPSHRFVVTDHVREEVTDHYTDQLQRLESAFALGILEETRVTDLQEVQLFAQLTAIGLGVGESSAIAVAAQRRFALEIDDKRAVKKLKNLGLDLQIYPTESIIVLFIQQSVLTIAEADAMKQDWGQNHRLRLPFGSFAEQVPSKGDNEQDPL